MNEIEVDVAVIGAGTAGMAAFRAARLAGVSAVLIESGEFGTTCARVGCMPSKLLLAAANGLHDAQALAPRGIEGTHELDADHARVLDYVRRERDSFVKSVLDEIDALPDGSLLRGQARFESPTRLSVGDHTRVTAKRTVIATGAAPTVPDELKVFGDTLITSDDLFELRTLPKRIAVFGAGPIALELGQALARLGVEIFMFGKGGHVAALSDKPVRDALIAALADEFHLDADAKFIEMSLRDGKPFLRFASAEGETRAESFDLVLAATGRAPNLKPLALENAGIDLNEKGVPRFDETTMQCGKSAIFVAGDCDGTRPWLHDAADEGKLAGDNAARFPEVRAVKRKVPFSLVFSEPQVAIVGASYDELDKPMTVTGEASFENQGRSRVMRQNRGLLHVYADAKTGTLRGAQGCGPAMEHLGHLLAWALQLELTLDEALKLPFYHPVVEEGLRSALKDADRKCYEERSETPPALPSAAGC
ncbi:dihydrolipoyl dehydrogenase [Burkholderia sp. SFA1]|uniref:dihydrolipoyl dehydrogenase n=1 Tax=unclassified Caballeronia TaxID=2646786 RepID=UPI001F4280A0|nr:MULTISPECIES: dihydrolipoyl dehydrogenase [unclassified Caballeronia]MCE4544524.1 dihydrolipoyl dehydrogenase [Caballeronia sp. PC1]MCE4571676.1 dihydrolipoyl dehydrogenase [Caballeronia sp. CLC5]BBP98410.1 dihydrolipoyl dehydrogenase [Burkholderia sp. SFA1]